MKVVVDTSVVLKWFVKENEALVEQAELLWHQIANGQIDCVIPDLLIYELGNALLYSKKLPSQEIQGYYEEFFSLGLTMIRIDSSLIHETTSIAKQYAITIYDAVFVAVAQKYGIYLISAHPKHHGKIKDGTVILLKDYPM